MSLLFNMLSRLVIAFLPRSKYLLISWLQSPSAVIFGAQESKICPCFLCFPIYLHEVMGRDTMVFIFECWVLSQLLHSSFTFFKRLFSSSSHFAIRVVSSAYLRLLIFLLAILTPACVSSSLTFHMMYCAYKLNKQGDNTQLWHTPFPILNQCSMFHVQFQPLFLDLHTGFSGGR